MLNDDFTYNHYIKIYHFAWENVVDKVKQLMCNFQNKTKDTVHIGLLQNALKHDLILKRVYKTIQFKQSS